MNKIAKNPKRLSTRTVTVNTAWLESIELEYGSIEELVRITHYGLHPYYVFTQFFDANFERDPTANSRMEVNHLYDEFLQFCLEQMNKGHKIGTKPSKREFAKLLQARDIYTRRSTGNRLFVDDIKRKAESE